MNLLTDALRTTARVFIDGGRVLVVHWPELVGLFLAGWAGRMGFLWLTTVVSNVSPTAALFVLPFAPLATLLSLVLMLRATAPTLNAFRGLVETATARERWREDLTVAAQVLIPFLAVYATAGLLKEDAMVFVADATADEMLNAGVSSTDFGRAVYAEGWALIVLVLIALVARKVISLLELTKRHVAWSAVAVYIEVLWVMTLANAFAHQLDELSRWVLSRRAIDGIVTWWEGVVAWLRSISALMTAVVDAVATFLGGLGTLVIVPVAWLAIGAAVFGASLKATAFKVETHDEVTQRLKAIPRPVRRVVSQVVEPLTTPVQNTVAAIAKIASAGVLSMVLFCVVFYIASSLQTFVYMATRLAFGPGTDLRQYAMSPFMQLGGRLVYFLVALSLLAAAVNAIVLSQRSTAEPGPAETAPARQGAAERPAGAGTPSDVSGAAPA